MKGKDYLRLLGVKADASPEEIEARYNELVAFLRSSQIPDNLRGWARHQRVLVEEAYSALIEEEDEDEDEQGVTLRQGSTRTPFLKLGRLPPFAIVFLGLGVGAIIGLLALVAAPWAIKTWRGTPPPDISAGDTGGAQYLSSMKKTIDDLKATVAKDPTNKQALFDLGEIHITGEDWESTIYWFNRLLEVDPTNTHALTDVGTANFNLGRYGNALVSWQKVLELAPNDAQAHYNLGFLYAFGSPPDPGLSQKHFEAVMQLAPDSNIAKEAKAHLEAFKEEGATTGGKP
ncbi:MAG: tetratricopeptide repeat protein [Chloroflexi bacterium]|nr:tetratricopeptide repeat protein [Chloroflexota bacterium]